MLHELSTLPPGSTVLGPLPSQPFNRPLPPLECSPSSSPSGAPLIPIPAAVPRIIPQAFTYWGLPRTTLLQLSLGLLVCDAFCPAGFRSSSPTWDQESTKTRSQLQKEENKLSFHQGDPGIKLCQVLFIFQIHWRAIEHLLTVAKVTLLLTTLSSPGEGKCFPR